MQRYERKICLKNKKETFLLIVEKKGLGNTKQTKQKELPEFGESGRTRTYDNRANNIATL